VRAAEITVDPFDNARGSPGFRGSPPDRVRLVRLLSPLLVARLLLALRVAHNALIGTVGRPGFRLWHALLAAMSAALILYTFQIVFFGHRDRTLF
jgi:hypothetical protein